MKQQHGFTSFELIIVILILLGVGGWIANIVKLVHMIDGAVTAMFIARAIGIFFAPLGAILGFC
jgi:hypothetical protein